MSILELIISDQQADFPGSVEAMADRTAPTNNKDNHQPKPVKSMTASAKTNIHKRCVHTTCESHLWQVWNEEA